MGTYSLDEMIQRWYAEDLTAGAGHRSNSASAAGVVAAGE